MTVQVLCAKSDHLQDADGFTALELAQVAEHDEVVQILGSRL